jgi:hypothetical protein
VVVVGIAAARPAKHRDQPFEILDGLFAVAIDIGDVGILPDPETAIDTGSEVFGELAMKFGPDDAGFLSEVNMDPLLSGGE